MRCHPIGPGGAAPVEPAERQGVVDALRGFALIGVLTANLGGWVNFALPEGMATSLTTTTTDRATSAILAILVEGKFITLFSLLFGYGFGLILDRVASRGVAFAPFFIRRMLILFAAGIVHLGWWWGEILSTYAFVGLLLLVFRECRTRTLVIWGLALLCMVTPAIQATRMLLLPPVGDAFDQVLERYVAAIRSGSPSEVFRANYQAAGFLFLERGVQWRDTAEVLAKFLLGYAALRSGLMRDDSAGRGAVRRLWQVSAIVAIVYLVFETWLHVSGREVESRLLQWARFAGERVGILGLALFYAMSVVRGYRAGRMPVIFAAVQSVGTMSLTNYLTHTACYTLIYYGCGFGAIGRIHLQWTIPLTAAIYVLQVVFSRVWLARFRYGPCEWLWRMASYAKVLPLRRVAHSVA